jgi:hypothetical protein
MAFVFTGNIGVILSLLTDLSTVCVGKPENLGGKKFGICFLLGLKLARCFLKPQIRKKADDVHASPRLLP